MSSEDCFGLLRVQKGNHTHPHSFHPHCHDFSEICELQHASAPLTNLHRSTPNIFQAGEPLGPVFQDDKFYLGKRLGSGSFGQVFLAKNRRGKELAVKVESLGDD